MPMLRGCYFLERRAEGESVLVLAPTSVSMARTTETRSAGWLGAVLHDVELTNKTAGSRTGSFPSKAMLLRFLRSGRSCRSSTSSCLFFRFFVCEGGVFFFSSLRVLYVNSRRRCPREK